MIKWRVEYLKQKMYFFLTNVYIKNTIIQLVVLTYFRTYSGFETLRYPHYYTTQSNKKTIWEEHDENLGVNKIRGLKENVAKE